MTRRSMTIAAITAGVLLCGCEQRDQAQSAATANDTVDTPVDVNAVQSIMRPAVIEETQPVEAPDPEPVLPIRATIAFASGSALDAEGAAAIDALLATPTLTDDMQFVVRGHSDAVGSDRENLVTSANRADAVAAYLEENGIAAERITVIALGERRPIAPSAHPDGSDNPEGRAQNRRVEIVAIPAEPTPPVASPDAAAEGANADERQP